MLDLLKNFFPVAVELHPAAVLITLLHSISQEVGEDLWLALVAIVEQEGVHTVGHPETSTALR